MSVTYYAGFAEGTQHLRYFYHRGLSTGVGTVLTWLQLPYRDDALRYKMVSAHCYHNSGANKSCYLSHAPPSQNPYYAIDEITAVDAVRTAFELTQDLVLDGGCWILMEIIPGAASKTVDLAICFELV